MERKGQQWIRVLGSYKGRVKKPNSLLCYDLMLRYLQRRRKLTPLLFCGFLEETTTIDSFWCWETHPSLSKIPSRYFTVHYSVQFSDCAAQPVRAQVIERGFVRLLETVSDLADSFRPIRELAKVHLLSHLSSVFDGGISQKVVNIHLGHNSWGSTFGVLGDILEQI